jgi:competence protein ComEA
MRKWLERYKAFIAFSLVVLIIIGGVFLFQKHPWSKGPLEIVLTTPTAGFSPEAQVYVAGAVMSPGWYPLEPGEGIEEAIMAAGGVTSDADLTKVRLYVFGSGESFEPQKVDINRAEVWLLEALRGIGPTLAQRIVDYRQANGPFERIEDLKRVDGIGEAKYDGLKDLITVE